jgi:hypothetical protein
MKHIQLLPLGAFGRRGQFVGCRRYRFGRGRMHGMKAAALHALKHQHMAAIVYNGNAARASAASIIMRTPLEVSVFLVLIGIGLFFPFII